MSAPEATTTPAPSTPPVKEKQDTKPGTLENVVRDMGPWHGYNPLPGHGHKWMLASHVDVSPTCYEMWAWLFDHCLALGAADSSERYGQRSPYAVMRRKDGMVEAHLEHMGADLDIEIRNLRHYWQEGIAAGIWRNGTEQEGTRRMYLCTEVKKAPEKRAETPDSRVCTYPWEKLPPYVSNELQKLSPETQKEFWDGWNLQEQQVWNPLLADATMACRSLIDHDKDTWIARFGPQKKRQSPKSSVLTGEEAIDEAARAKIDRAERVAKLALTFQGYVHTLKESAQSTSNGVHKAAYKPQNGGATLLRSETLQKGSERAGVVLSEIPPTARSEGQHSHEGEKLNPLPAPEPLVSAPRSSQPAPPDDDEKGAVVSFLTQTAQMQTSFPHTRFGSDLVSPENKGDFAWALAIVRNVGPPDVPGFVDDVRFRLGLLDSDALGKLPRPRYTPAHKPEERFLGLISEWATDWRRGAAQRERDSAEYEELERKRLAVEQAAAERQKREMIAYARKTLADPEANESDRALAREILESYGEGASHA